MPLRAGRTRCSRATPRPGHCFRGLERVSLAVGGKGTHDFGVHGYSSIRGWAGSTFGLCATNVSVSSTPIVMRT